jgi:membrane protein implicated in regulation of membrane protease activity
VSGGALIVVLILAALAVGVASVLGAPFLAIPIILLLPGPIITVEFLRRQYRQRQIARFRESASTTKAHFDEQDRQTLTR